LAAFLFICVSLSGQTPAAKARQSNSFAQAAEITFQKGKPATLPPHLSTLLGLTHEQPCEIAQGVERNGTVVRGIDVSLINQGDVVLFVVEESTRDQILYLTSASGRLRRLVRVRAGEGAVSAVTEADRKAFAKEKQFWVDRLVGAAAK